MRDLAGEKKKTCMYFIDCRHPRFPFPPPSIFASRFFRSLQQFTGRARVNWRKTLALVTKVGATVALSVYDVPVRGSLRSCES